MGIGNANESRKFPEEENWSVKEIFEYRSAQVALKRRYTMKRTFRASDSQRDLEIKEKSVFQKNNDL